MWKVLSVFNPFNWFGITKSIPDPKVRPLIPLNYEKNPELHELRKLGNVGPSKLRECQIGIEFFKEKGSSDNLPELVEAYKILLETKGCESRHLTFLNHVLGIAINNGFEFNLYEMADYLSKQIEAGRSILDLYKDFVPEANLNVFQKERSSSPFEKD